MELELDLEQSIKTRLRRSDLFSQLSDEQFGQLIGQLEPERLALGDLIPTRNQGVDLLVSGKIRLFERLPDGRENNLCTLDTTGECWSDSWLHASGNGILLARASQSSVLLKAELAAFENLAASNKQFKLHFDELKLRWENFCFLRQLAPFASIVSTKLLSLSRYSRRLRVQKDANDLAAVEGLFVLLQGEIECIQKNEQERLLPGQSFVLGNFGSFKADTEMCRVIEDADLIVITREIYSELLDHSPDLAELLAATRDTEFGLNAGLSTAAAAAFQPPPVQSAAANQAFSTETEEENLNPEEGSFASRIGRAWRQYPFIMQQSQMDCGVSCLAMVALYYGKRLDINDLRERADVSVEGTSMLALAETAEHVGFMSRGIRGTYEGLLNARLPLICFYKQNHFVVLYEINKNEARIGDPAEGLLKVSREEFTKNFSKSALELVPTVELKRAPGAKNPLSILLPLLKPYSGPVRDVLIAGIVYQALMIITPFFSQTIIDRVIVHEDISMLNMLLLGMILVSCFQSALTFARGILISTLSSKIDHSLFVQFFKHLLSLPLKYFEQRSSGDILARFNENARITAFLSGNTITVILDSCMAVIYMAVLFYYKWSFGLATLVYVSLLMAAVTAYTPLLRGFSNEIFKKTVANDSCVIETVHGIEKIKSAAAENRTRWKWEILFVDKLSVTFRQQLAYNGYSQVTQLVHLIGRVLLMWLGANLVIEKTFTVGQYMAANMIASMAVDPILRLISLWQQLQSVNISVERLGDVFRALPEQTGQKARMHDLRGFIEFKNVTFRYNEHAQQNTLLNISLRIQPNQMIAIVGRSGCGKTTLARLMQGLYLPSSGSVMIDGVDTSQIELSDLRKKIGVVAQHEFFFSGTVRENLAFYMPDAPLEKIIEVAKIAGIHEKIKTMGSGYDTMLSEGGQNLSGGERQRMAIARALLHDPRILIFDEATAALDSESERHIQLCMDEIRKGRTMVVIAHRLSTIKSADLILVVDQGQIVEAGNHAGLLQKKGLYFHLCSQQSI